MGSPPAATICRRSGSVARVAVAVGIGCATVVLVTRDRGLQNKARAAELPAIDVEDL
jgi:rRNA-processing protein FCF1